MFSSSFWVSESTDYLTKPLSNVIRSIELPSILRLSIRLLSYYINVCICFYWSNVSSTYILILLLIDWFWLSSCGLFENEIGLAIPFAANELSLYVFYWFKCFNSTESLIAPVLSSLDTPVSLKMFFIFNFIIASFFLGTDFLSEIYFNELRSVLEAVPYIDLICVLSFFNMVLVDTCSDESGCGIKSLNLPVFIKAIFSYWTSFY